MSITNNYNAAADTATAATAASNSSSTSSSPGAAERRHYTVHSSVSNNNNMEPTLDGNPSFKRDDSYSSIESGNSDGTLVAIHQHLGSGSGSSTSSNGSSGNVQGLPPLYDEIVDQDEKHFDAQQSRNQNRARHGSSSYAQRLDEGFSDDADSGRLLPPSRRSEPKRSWWHSIPLLGNLAAAAAGPSAFAGSRATARRHQTIPLALSAMAPSSSAASSNASPYRIYPRADDYDDARSSSGSSSSCDDEQDHAIESNCHHCGSIVDGLESAASAGSLHRRHRPRPLLSRLPSNSRSSNNNNSNNRRRRNHRSSRRARDEEEELLSARQSLWDLFFILVPTIAACTLSFALGVSFEMLRSSILAAKGGHGRGGGRGGGGRWAHAHEYSHHPHRWRPTSYQNGEGGAQWIDVSEQVQGQQQAQGSDAAAAAAAVGAGCSAMDLALARLTPATPIRIHSHNDETRDKPLTEALSYGALSVEADVWLMPTSPTLYVGHELETLTESATLKALYIDPLVRILEHRNANTAAPSSSSSSQRPWNGVYESAPNATLYLFLDIKSDSLPTWQAVLDALEPLRSRGWLTHWTDGKELTWGPITVIGTGDAPVEHVAPLLNRDVFIDAPIGDLKHVIDGVDGKRYEYNSTLSPIASGNWLTNVGYMGLLPASRWTREHVRKMSDAAHERGILVRWWNNPAWPVFARDRAWRIMLDEGVDLINADDLEGAEDVLVDSGKPRQPRRFSPPSANAKAYP